MTVNETFLKLIFEAPQSLLAFMRTTVDATAYVDFC